MNPCQKASKITVFPPEILLHVFSLAADNYDSREEPSVGVGNLSPWAKDLRVKKSVVRVCKTWRHVGLEALYRYVYLHRVGQLCALVRTLEGGKGMRGWVRSIHGIFFVPPSWEVVYLKNVLKLMMLCSSCRELTWKISWGSTDNEPASTLSSIFKILCRSSLAESTTQSSLVSLRNLSFSLDFISFANPCKNLSTVTFPVLEDLTCEVRKANMLSSLDIVSYKFRMPKLRRLEIIFPPPWTPAEHQSDLTEMQIASIFTVLKLHGGKLSNLALDLYRVDFPIGTLNDVVKLTPNLVSLRFPFAAFSTDDMLTTPFASLREFEVHCFQLREEIPGVYEPGPLEPIFAMASTRVYFPNLKSIAIYAQHGGDNPFHESIDPPVRDNAFHYFLAWVKKFRELDVVLLEKDGMPLISPDQERWRSWSEDGEGDRGDVEDADSLSDSSYIYESEPDIDTDVSSDCEGEPPLHIVELSEALEMFDRSVQVDFSYSDE